MANRRPVRLDSLDELPLSRRELLMGAGGLALAATLAACGGGSSSSSGSGGTTSVGTPKKGGSFRLGVTGGSTSDLVDGQTIITKPDQARLACSWETLVGYDENQRLANNGLAESLTQDNPTQWTVKIHDGIEFNNGKTLTADDVVYSLQRMVDPKLGLFSGAGLGNMDAKNIKKVDNLTVVIPLLQPDGTIADQLAQYYAGIVPVGYSTKNNLKYVGTGPFIIQSFTPGQQSVATRSPNYWRTGQPYFDKVTIIDFPDDSARVNALLSGQVDAITDVVFAQIDVVKQNSNLRILDSPGGGWLPMCMAVDMPPFDNNDVREAMRLIVDRQAILEQTLSGHGSVANDLFGRFDVAYDSDLPQREQDLDKAKSLLSGAGVKSVDLHTTNGAAGMVDQANVFAQQATGAGITVNVHNDPGYYGDQYLKLPFSVDFWGTRPYLPQVSNSMLPKSPYNETHWDKLPQYPQYESLYKQAVAASDQGKRVELIHEMQKMEYDMGGYIIAFFNNLVDGYSSKVQGFQVTKATQNLDSFGHGFRTIWFG
jgi:peptide/nickel transport system substrate-binding protein